MSVSNCCHRSDERSRSRFSNRNRCGRKKRRGCSDETVIGSSFAWASRGELLRKKRPSRNAMPTEYDRKKHLGSTLWKSCIGSVPRRSPLICPDCVIATQGLPTGSTYCLMSSQENIWFKTASTHWHLGVRLLNMVLNWRSTFQTCPLLQQAGGRRGSRRDSVLAGAGVGFSFSSLIFPCWLLQRGFLINRFQTISPGDHR